MKAALLVFIFDIAPAVITEVIQYFGKQIFEVFKCAVRLGCIVADEF